VKRLSRALGTLRHRGPDDEGLCLVDRAGGRVANLRSVDSHVDVRLSGAETAQAFAHDLALGHRRFSIIDVSACGHQPFWSSDETVCAAFNGEIYNFREMRSELETLGRRFRSDTDTEVLVAAYQQWHLDCFHRLNGFWAVSLYDAERRELVLCRDRIGKAPLFLSELGTELLWASELKALQSLADPASFTVNEQSLVDFLVWRRRNLHDETVYREISSLPAGHWLCIDARGRRELRRYWSIPTSRADERDLDLRDRVGEFRALFSDAVRLRLHADVPVCTQLSGGIDSSAITAFAAGVSDVLDVYTVRFADAAANEEPFARLVADRYPEVIRYHVIEPPDDDLIQHMDAYVQLVEEPFHSPNQFTNHRIWREMASNGYRVNLYGAGGDEVFAGYPLYVMPFLTSLLSRGRLGRFLHELTSDSRHGSGLSALRANALPFARHLAQLAGCSRERHSLDALPVRFAPDRKPRPGPSLEIERRLIELMSEWQMSYWVRLDNQNCMGVPLELRHPFLDHRVVEFCFGLPISWLVRDGWLKWFLRIAAEDHLPREITWRSVKMGFPFPIERWLERHRPALISMATRGDCPYLDATRLERDYEVLRRRDPEALWRVLSMGLWWTRCVRNLHLA
jgi:asparagine synthase (glutamine-hydrolysing)